MPIIRVKNGFHVANTTTKKPLTLKTAVKQLKAIKANQARK
jgi:hypothetical protein